MNLFRRRMVDNVNYRIVTKKKKQKPKNYERKNKCKKFRDHMTVNICLIIFSNNDFNDQIGKLIIILNKFKAVGFKSLKKRYSLPEINQSILV